MDLFERYLHAVRSFLPKRQQDDVVRELSDDLRSQAEEREAELGRPLNRAEQEEILKQWGHPMLLASRYRTQRQLVGPAVFPLYWLVLRIALGIALLVHVIAAVILLASGRPSADVLSSLAKLPLGPLLIVFGWVTLVFAVLDRYVPRLPFVANWNPSALPDTSPDASSSSLSCRITEVALATIFVLWLAAIPRNQWLIFGPASTLVQLGPIWFDMHVPLLLLASVALIGAWVNLFRPQPATFRLVGKLLGNLVTIAVLLVVLNADVLIIAMPAAGDSGARIARICESGFRIGFGVAVIAAAIEGIRDAMRLVNRKGVLGGWSPRRG